MKRLGSVLLWAVIAAAFIGPGTVTTAASAGATYGFALLWALVFSTGACFVLQEASARLTVVSGQTLGRALRARFSSGFRGGLLLALILGAILLGCAAYEAGNILGGVAGAVMATGGSADLLTVASGVLAALLLWFQAPKAVARWLSLVVAVMGVAFLLTAWKMNPSISGVFRGSSIPSLPAGSGVLVLGLIGTTVVPYNIFLGSGLAGGQKLAELRLGLGVAIGVGGLISMAVVVVGTAVTGSFDFGALGEVLSSKLGGWAYRLFAVGLLGAGLSSAITAPLAAAITARDLFRRDQQDERWSSRSWRYRAVWGSILAVGIAFGVSGVRPVPAIILAQALNGVLLPLVSIFLLIAINDRDLMKGQTNGLVGNLMMGGVVWVSLLLGVFAVWRATARTLGLAAPRASHIILASILAAVIVAVPILYVLGKGRGS